MRLPFRRKRPLAPIVDTSPIKIAVPSDQPWKDWVFTGLTETKNIWGGVEIRADDPPVETYQDVLYVEFKEGGRWGLFDNHGAPIESAIDRVHESGDLTKQIPEIPERSKGKILKYIDEHFVYAGRLTPHFGHFLTESLPRYWSLISDRSEKKKILVHCNNPQLFFSAFPFSKEILNALGLTEEDFSFWCEAVRLRSVEIPHASFRNQAYAHPAFQKLCQYIGEKTISRLEINPNRRPVWLSKSALRSGVARVVNELEVEQELYLAGVDVIHPEDLSFPEQVRLFLERSTIIGTTGSAFHVSLFAPPPKRMILIDHVEYKNSNFELFDCLSEVRSEHYFPGGTRDLADKGKFIVQRAFPEPRKVAKAILDLL